MITALAKVLERQTPHLMPSRRDDSPPEALADAIVEFIVADDQVRYPYHNIFYTILNIALVPQRYRKPTVKGNLPDAPGRITRLRYPPLHNNSKSSFASMG